MWLLLSNRISFYQRPSLGELTQTVAKRNSQLEFLRGGKKKKIHLIVMADLTHTEAGKFLVFPSELS